MRPAARTTALLVVVGALALAGLAGTGRHTVKRGETLSSIAHKYGLSIATLQYANALKDPNRIVAGAVLSIPDGSDAPTGGGGTTRYVVRAGDTLASIARKLGTTPGAIQVANTLKNPNLIVIGRTLTIPVAAVADPNPAVVEVQPGDTLTKVSARTGVPVSVIAAANGLKSPYTLYIGTRLLLGVRNGAAAGPLVTCPAPGTRFMNDWGFPRADTGSHQGTDMLGTRGTPLVAVASGNASQVVGNIGGNQVKFTADDGTLYWYAHLDKFGKHGHVEAGQVIGYMGDTGDAKGGPVHLHFEVHPGGGAAVNPYPFLVSACR